MAGVTGARGSNRRRFLVCGGLALGIVVVLLAGFMAEASVKQVYWAVYSRLHPMRDSGDAHGFSTEETVYTQTFDGSDSRRSAAEKAIKSGEKEEVRLIKTQADKIHSKSDVRKAASEAKTRHSDTESAQEKEHVDNLADELSKKATAAFSAEIEAVAGSKEADRLIDNLQQDSAIEKTKLEKEAAEAAEKSSKGASSRKTLWQALKFSQS